MSLRLGLLGHQISYSLSPRIFAWLFAETGLSGSYDIVEVTPQDFLSSARRALLDYQGLNVTIPHKQTAFALSDLHSDTARQCRAVNALKMETGGTIAGHNTDVAGIASVLREMIAPDRSKSALILGGGGAARAALVCLQAFYPQTDTTVMVRASGSSLKREFPTVKILIPQQSNIDLTTYDLIIQSTPAGSTQQPGTPFNAQFILRPQSNVIDMIYAPRETEFLKQAAEHGARTQNGMTMLIGQALHAFDWWTGVRVPFQHASRELLSRLGEP